MTDLASDIAPEPGDTLDRDALLDMLIDSRDRPSPDLRRFRFALGGLRRTGNVEVVKVLLEHPEALEIDPRRVGDYLRHSDAVAGGWVAEFFPLLEAQPTDNSDAVHLHLLRAASARTWGRAEGELFGGIAFDPRRRIPVRSWAVEAEAKTPGWHPESSLGLALTEGRPMLQRAATLSFRSNMKGRSEQLALDEVERHVPDLDPTVAWVRRQAA